MSNKLYVGNLSFKMSEGDLESAFAEHGTVNSVKIIMDRETGRSKGFGFVEMGDADQAQSVSKTSMEKTLVVETFESTSLKKPRR